MKDKARELKDPQGIGRRGPRPGGVEGVLEGALATLDTNVVEVDAAPAWAALAALEINLRSTARSASGRRAGGDRAADRDVEGLLRIAGR